MATETATAPMATSTPSQEDVPFVLTKETEAGSVAPAEDRLSPRESPEPSEEATAGPKAAAQGSAVNGSDGKASSTTSKTKKKEDKSIEYILRALSSLSSPEEKLAALCKKYADLHEEHRVLQTSFKSQQRKMTVGQREKDQLQAEHTKTVMAKSKLESLCRELQKQNKAIKEESILRQKEEDEKRKEISAKFQTTIGEIQTQMTENHEKNVKLRDENQELVGKLKRFLDQEELREQQMQKLTKHRELENQLNETKLAHAAAILKEHEDRATKEKDLLLLQAAESQKKNSLLEAQLGMYKERYEEFQGTINKSNDMFQKLKSEMDKMGKRIKKLEKEGAQWKAKWEASNKALIDMAEEKARGDKDKQVLQTKVGKLESLCRALQGEMHGAKTSSPDTTDGSKNTSTAATTTANTTTSEAAPTANTTTSNPSSTPASATATPPNTPEENTSRASPNPESPANNLPPGQNGPIPGASSSSLPTPPAPSEGEGVSAVGPAGEEGQSSCQEEGSSSIPPDSSSSPSATGAAAVEQQAEALSSMSLSDPTVSSSSSS